MLEGNNPAAALVRYISDSRITCLVLGSWSSNFMTRYLMNLNVVGKNFCGLEVQRLISTS